jgi:hypothetical protein
LPSSSINFDVDLIDPHRWDRPVLKEAQQRGFDLVHKRTLSNPIFPWTFFCPYTVHLTFADPRSIKEYRGFIGAQTLVFNRNDRGKVEAASYIELFDCESKLFTIFADKEKRYAEDDLAQHRFHLLQK